MISVLTNDDVDNLTQLDANCFEVPWSKNELAEEISHYNAITIGYHEDKTLVGALLARIMIDEIWIFRIMVLPEYRRKKIAHQLLQKIIMPLKNSEEKNVSSVWIEVAKSNESAIRFYESEGFLRVSSRLGYYAANHLRVEPEDAWVMCLRL